MDAPLPPPPADPLPLTCQSCAVRHQAKDFIGSINVANVPKGSVKGFDLVEGKVGVARTEARKEVVSHGNPALTRSGSAENGTITSAALRTTMHANAKMSCGVGGVIPRTHARR
jgi:hypothetical protein